MTEPMSAGSQQPPASGDYQPTPPPDARWQALRDYLDKRITELKEGAIEELPPPGSLARVFQEKAATLASVRKQMDELEAEK